MPKNKPSAIQGWLKSLKLDKYVKCLIVDPIKEIGGHKKLFSHLQSFIKQLTSSVCGQ